MSTQQLSAAKLRFKDLLPVIAPTILLATYVGFYSFFLVCADNSTACGPISADAIRAVTKSPPEVAIYVARASWTLAAGLYLLACTAALVIAGMVLKEVLPESNTTPRWQPILIIMFVALDVALLMSFWTTKDISSPAQQLLQATVGQTLPHINKYFRLFDAISLTATLSLAFAASAILVQRDPKPEKENLRRRQMLLRYVLYIGAALLAIAVLQLSARLSWGASYLSTSSNMAPSINTLVTGIVNSMGSFYALVMAAVYIPAALILQSRVKELAAQEAPDDPNTWLTNNGFTLSFTQYLPRIIALLGPMLAGPLGTLLIQASKAVSGTIL